ncbi:MAG: energy-coupling factor transporter transmembrane protein EcfT [Paracoccaceae bacterium]
MLTLTSPIQTWAHRIPASVKMAALCLWTALLFHLGTPIPLVSAAATIAALTLSGGMQFAKTSAQMLRPLWPFAVIVALWQLWQHDPQTGVIIILRMVTAVAAANFVTATTRLGDMIDVITTLARPLPIVGLKPRLFGLAIALTIRFIPVMLLNLAAIRESWRARSPRRPGWRTFTPMILATLDDADRVAEALRARGGAG